MSAPPERLVILLPLYNDWGPAAALLDQLDRALAGSGFAPEVLIVDDGSSDPLPGVLRQGRYRTLERVNVLHLKANIGHQRAIAVGLTHTARVRPGAVVAVMDADGQDRAEDLPRLIERFGALGGEKAVFAARTRRMEKLWFQVLYYTYRWLHLVLTGAPVKVGNFSVLPARRVLELTVIPEVWNHYAAAVIRSRIPFETVPIARWLRERGRSHMRLTGLLLHGLSAFFVYGEILGTRLLMGVGGLTAAASLTALLVFGTYLALHQEVPNWLPWMAGLAGLLLLQFLQLALLLIFIVVGSRAHARFLPARDCPLFEGSLETLFERPTP